MTKIYQEIFQNDTLFQEHFKALSNNGEVGAGDCSHSFTEEVSFDENAAERVCRLCGLVTDSETITDYEKLSGCMSLEDFMNVRYGPATAQGLQSFMLPSPTDKRLKVREKFIDIGILSALRTYTNLQRIAEQCNIPKFFADEAMRSLLRTRKGLYSDHQQVNALKRAIYIAMFTRKNLSHLITALEYYEDIALEPRKEVEVNPGSISRKCLMARCGI